MNDTAEHVDALAPLDEEAIDRMEREVFAGIRSDRAGAATRARRRRRGWYVGGAAAAVVLVAAVIAPTVSGIVSPMGASSAVSEQAPDIALPAVPRRGADAGVADGAESLTTESAAGSPDAVAGRDVIATASATVQVSDAADAVREIGDAAVARGGFVESVTLEGTGAEPMPAPVDGAVDGVIEPLSMPMYPQGQWITVRVPSAELIEVIDELADIGDVLSSSVNRSDVTEQTVDLRARVDATEASVARLTELMAQAGSVADLLAAEQALSERQALLESYQQQLASLENQVALSSLTVTLTEPSERVTADPAGFGDGLAAGWNGLVATLNGIVVALGFLLPWLLVVGVAALIVWAVVRLVRRRRAGVSRRETTSGTTNHDSSDVSR